METIILTKMTKLTFLKFKLHIWGHILQEAEAKKKVEPKAGYRENHGGYIVSKMCHQCVCVYFFDFLC